LVEINTEPLKENFLPKYNFEFYCDLNFNFYNAVKFNERKRTIMAADEIGGYCISLFHPKLPILAFAGYLKEVLLLKAESFGTPFSNWIESNRFGLHSQIPKQVSTLEWNVSLSI
jgi:hypothetical protein